MLNRSKKGLEVFDSFQIDWNLPKHKKQNEKEGLSLKMNVNSMDASEFDLSDDISEMRVGGSANWVTPSEVSGASGLYVDGNSKSLLDRIKSAFKKKKKEEKPKITITDFFRLVKSSAINIEKYTDRVNDYMSAYKYAKQLNQDALADELRQKIDEAKYESMLFSADMTTVITEEQVVKFYKESPKGLALTWIRNYIRIIPEVISEKKKKADELKVFDNYVILHYDPDKKAYKEEKDPILFGVIKGLRKLYYIGDWTDEYCDLTLEQFITKFGSKAIEANNITSNFKLNGKN